MIETYIVAEPLAVHKKKGPVKKFDSFETLENDQLEYFVSLAPEELLKNLKSFQWAAFGIKEESILNKPNRKI